MTTESSVNDLLNKDAQDEDAASNDIARTAATATEQGAIQDSIKKQQAAVAPTSSSSFITDPDFWHEIMQNSDDMGRRMAYGTLHGIAKTADLVFGGDSSSKMIEGNPELQAADPSSISSKVGEAIGDLAPAVLAPESKAGQFTLNVAKQSSFWAAIGFATGDDRGKDALIGAAGGAGGEAIGASLKAAGTFLKTFWNKGGTEVALRAAETAPHGLPTETTAWTPDAVVGADTATPKATGEPIPSSAPSSEPSSAPASEPTTPPVFNPKAFVGSLVADASPESLQSLREAIVSGDLSKVGALQRFMPNLPWAQLADGGNLQGTFAALADHYEGVVQEIGGAKVIPRELQLQFAANQGRDPSAVMDALNNLGQHTDDGGLAARVLAGHHLDIETASQLHAAATAVSQATVGTAEHVAAVNSFNQALELKVAVQAVMSGSKNELGRSLGALRFMNANQAVVIPDGFGDGKTATEIADAFLKKVTTPDGGINLQAANEGARALKAIGPFDWLLEMGRNGLLSSPALHYINAKANIIRMGVSLLEQYIAAGVGTISKGIGTVVHAVADASGVELPPMQQQLSLRTANAWALGAWNTATDLSVWKDAMVKGFVDSPVNYSGQVNRVAIKGGTVELADLPNALQGVHNIQGIVDMANKALENGGNAALDAAGNAIRLPGRLLGSVDHLNVTIAQRASMTQQSYMRASSMADATGLTGDARATFISDQMKELILNPTDGMLLKAQTDGSYASMQEGAQWRPSFFGMGGNLDKPGFGAGVNNMLNQSKLIKMMIAPFTTRPGNAMRQAIFDYSPLGAAFDRTTQAALAGGGIDMNLAAARMLIGTSAMWTAWHLMETGAITGSSQPGDLSQLAERPDYSIRLGDTSIPYKRMEPAGIWLGSIADAYNAVKARNTTYDMDGNPSAPLTRALMATALASGHMLVELPAMSGIKRLLDVVTTRAGAGLEQKGISFVGGAASEAVPFSGLGSWINTEIDGHRHIPENIWQAISLRIPGMESDIPVRRDLFGRPVNAVNQYAVTQGSQDPLSQAVSKVTANVQPTKNWLVAPTDGQQGVPLPDNLSRELEKIKGEQSFPQFGNQTFPQYAAKFIQSPNWLNAGVHGTKVAPDNGTYEHLDMLKELLKTGNHAALQQLMVNHPDLRDRMRQAAMAQMKPIIPVAPPQ